MARTVLVGMVGISVLLTGCGSSGTAPSTQTSSAKLPTAARSDATSGSTAPSTSLPSSSSAPASGPAATGCPVQAFEIGSVLGVSVTNGSYPTSGGQSPLCTFTQTGGGYTVVIIAFPFTDATNKDVTLNSVRHTAPLAGVVPHFTDHPEWGSDAFTVVSEYPNRPASNAGADWLPHYSANVFDVTNSQNVGTFQAEVTKIGELLDAASR